MFPFFSLQTKFAECATELLISSATMAASIATVSLNAVAKTVSDTARQSKTPTTTPLNLPVYMTSGSGIPMFQPFMHPVAGPKSQAIPTFSAFEWPARTASWPVPTAPAWPAHMWFNCAASPYAVFANPFLRKRSAMEQAFDPLGFWSGEDIAMPYPFAMTSMSAASTPLLPAAATIKTMQATAVALTIPFFVKSSGFFPTALFGV